MGESFSFELLKLRKRPATLILGTILLLITVLLGYLLSYVAIAGVDGNPPPEADRYLLQLYPENVVAYVLSSILSGLGGAVALILGALAVGSEYGWDTLKAVLIQRPGRLAVFSGKLLAVGVVLALFTLASFALGALSSCMVAELQDAPVEWPSFGELLRGAGAGWLIMAAWAALGAFLATLFRGTALAIGLGLAYALVLENLVFGLSFQNETAEKIGQAFLGRNSTDLASSFGNLPEGVATPFEAVEPAQAALVLGAYLIAFAALAVILFRRRDVV